MKLTPNQVPSSNRELGSDRPARATAILNILLPIGRFGLVAGLVLLVPALAAAQQPFYTDNADVTPKGGVHIESFDEYDWLQRSQAPHREQNTINMRVNYGLGHGLELDLDSPLIIIVNDAAATPRRPFGIGDTDFGVKYNIKQETKTSSMPALTAAVYIEVPTGEQSTGLGSGLTDVWMYGVVQKTLAAGLIARANGGYLFTGNPSTGVVGITGARGHVATMNGSLAREFSKTLTLGIEVAAAATNAVATDRTQLQAMVGGNYTLRAGLTLDLGFIVGHFPASPRTGVQVGFSSIFRRSRGPRSRDHGGHDGARQHRRGCSSGSISGCSIRPGSPLLPDEWHVAVHIRRPEMAKRNFVWLAAAVAIGVGVAHHVQAQSAERTTVLTFSQPVQLPGVSLGSGAYIFEVAAAPDVVRVMNRNRTIVYYMGFTSRIDRPAGLKTSAPVTLEESAGGVAPRVHAWWPSGESTGHQFNYANR